VILISICEIISFCKHRNRITRW